MINYIVSPLKQITYKGKKRISVGFPTEQKALTFIYERGLKRPVLYIRKDFKKQEINKDFIVKQNKVGQIISIKKK